MENKLGIVCFFTPLSQMLRICQLPLKGGAQYSLPPGGEGVTVGDGRGDLFIPTKSNLINQFRNVAFDFDFL